MRSPIQNIDTSLSLSRILLVVSAFFSFIFSCDIVLAGSPNTAMSGTYTVGPGGNYTTLTDAVNAYNTSTLGGNVIFTLTNSVYTSGENYPIIIKKNPSAGATATLLIRPAANVNAVISGSVSYGALIRVLGDYIYIDGSNNGTNSRNLTITNTSITQPRVVLFGSVGTSAVTNCGLKNITLINGISDKSILVIADTAMTNPPTAGYFSNISIENNQFKKAIYGVYCRGMAATLNGSGVNFIGNDLSSSGPDDSLQQCGIYLEGVDGALIKGNSIGNFKRLDSISDKGIYISSNVRNTNIIGNNIFNINNTANKGLGAHGIFISTGISNAAILVSNNMISNISGDGNDLTNSIYNLENPAGILLSSSSTQSGISIYHNSIYLGGVIGFTNTLNRAGAVSACIRMKSNSYADIRNNILVNNLGLAGTTGFGAVAIMISNDRNQFIQLNYNNYFVSPAGSGNKLIGYMYTISSLSPTLSAWRTATSKDGASVNIMPQFLSATNLHLSNTSNNSLNNLGTAIAGLDYDIDATSRNLISPDMGCDEFVPVNTAGWIGKYSTDWNYAANWESNFIPDPNANLTMSVGLPYLPHITNLVKINGLTLSGSSNAVLITLESGSILQVGGTISKAGGYVDASNATFGFIGSALQSLPSGFFLDNKVLNLEIGNSNISGVSLSGPVDVYRSLTFTSAGARLNTNGYLTLKSNETGTAYVGDLTGKTINGEVTVERFIPTGITHPKSWQFLSVPVSGSQTINQAWQDTSTAPNQNRYPGYGTVITSNLGGSASGCYALGFDIYTPTGGTLKTYNSQDSAWVGVGSTNLPVANKKGYFVFVRGDRSVITSSAAPVPTVLRSKGKLFTASAGELPPSTAVAANRFESVGNPYASAIDFRYIDRVDGQVDNTFYVWDPLLSGSYGLGGFQTISSANGYRPVPGGTLNYSNVNPCTTIQSGQAFFVHATGSNSGGNISFREVAKVAGSSNVFRDQQTEAPDNYIHTLLFTATGVNDKIADANFISIDSTAGNDYDSRDAIKIMNAGENFAVLSNARKLSVESRSMPNIGDTIHFFMSNLKKQNYQLRIAAAGGFLNGTVPVLFDRYLNMELPLSATDTTFQTFNVNDDLMSSRSDRFLIVMKIASALPVDFVSVNATWSQNGKKDITWEVANAINISHYEVERSYNGYDFALVGHVIQGDLTRSKFHFSDDETGKSGMVYYRIKAAETSNHCIYSRVVTLRHATSDKFEIRPNPVTENIIKLFAPIGVKADNYHWKMLNENGQLLIQGNVNISSAGTAIMIPISKNIPSGNYLFAIENGIMETTTIKVLLQ